MHHSADSNDRKKALGKNAPKKRATRKIANDSAGKAEPIPSEPQSCDPSEGDTAGFPIVGIGASAGGLEAFTQFLQDLPADTGMAFVLVQHLDPDHTSALTEILSRVSALPVREITEELAVERDQVYIIPPNASLDIVRGVLKLRPRPTDRGAHRSIDPFFEALAQDQRHCAIGVILSGTASDGTIGLEAIKAEGGITFAQDETAKHDSMPRSAIAAGCVDFVLPPAEIARELTRIARHPLVNRSAQVTSAADASGEKPGKTGVASEGGFGKILPLLRKRSGVDFSFYKSNTIERRIHRRMVLGKHVSLDAYARHLRGDAKELEALFFDVLINVTGFFRNPESFDFLQSKVFPEMCSKGRDEPLRVWVLACSTGQEAYSLAMAFTEFFDRLPRPPKLQIFASDLNEAVLVKARAGLYAKASVQDVSPERLRRFFVEEEGGYRVIKPLRQTIVFARQNILSDPPFSRLDLVSCRNLLIYFEPILQKKLIPTFHYALNSTGYLFLGASESIGTFAELFVPVDKKHKIFLKKADVSAALPLQPITRRQGGRKSAAPTQAPEGVRVEFNAQREADRVTRNRYAPPAVLLNANLQILEFRGDTSGYLKSPTGQANFDLLKMAGEGLMLPLRAALTKAQKENQVVRRENVRLNHNGRNRTMNFEIVPLKNLKERCYLVFFEDAKKGAHLAPSAPLPQPTLKEEPRRISALEAELKETRDYLQSVEEEKEASSEELQASNEEISSANEELQSINEELETSKEELESSNEELTTVNDEMASRNEELNRLNSDLVNFQTSTHLVIVLLGRDLTIRRFSRQAAKQFNLRVADLGRSIGTVRHNLVFSPRDPEVPQGPSGAKNELSSAPPADDQRANAFAERPFGPGAPNVTAPTDVESLVAEVVDTLLEQEHEVRDKDGRWYALRVRPYVTLDNKVDGAVLVLVDIDALKRTEQTIRAGRDYAQNILETMPDSMLVLDSDLRVESANRSYYRSFRVASTETVGRSIFDLGNREWDIPRLRALLEKVLPKLNAMENFEVERDFDKIGRRTLILSARRMEDPAGTAHRILLAIDDVTERKRLHLEIQNARVSEAVIRTARDPLLILNADFSIHAANAAFYTTFETSPAETDGRSFYDLGKGQWNTPKLRELLGDVLPRNSPFDGFEVMENFERIGRRTVLLNARKLDDAENRPTRILVGMQDITQVLQFQADLRRSELRYRRLFEAARDGVLLMDPGTQKIIDANPFMTELTGRTRVNLRGRELFEIGLLPDGEACAVFFHKLREHGCVRHEDLVIQATTAVPCHVEMVSNLYVEADEQIIQCNVRDITDRKRTEHSLQLAQAALADRAGQLAQAVAERTAELTATNRQMEAFVYSIAHDLRAPLRAMEGYTSYLLEEEGPTLSETGREFARRINRSAQFMDALLSDLLTFSRLSQQEVALDSLALESVVRAVIARLGDEIQAKNARLESLGPWPTVMAHDSTLAQVLSNLISNALKFVAPGVPPAIRLRTEEQGQFVRVWVEDNGIGIQPENRAEVFRLFNRQHGERFPGTGVGLAIVEKGAERMGGRSGVESTPGDGSRFWFELRKA